MANDFQVQIGANTTKASSDIKKFAISLEKQNIDLTPSVNLAKAKVEAEKQMKELAKTLKDTLAKENITISDKQALSIVKQQVKEEENLANSISKAKEKSEQLLKIEKERQIFAQNKASNKALTEEYNQRTKLAEATQKQSNQIKTLMSSGGIDTSISKATTQYSKLSNVTTELQTDFKQLSTLHTALGASNTDKELISNYEKFNTTLAKVNNQMKVLSNEQGLTNNNAKIANSLDLTKTRADAAQKSFSAYTKTLNSSATKDYSTQINEISNAFENVKKSGNKVDMSKATESVQQFKSQMKDAGLEAQSFGQILKNDISKFAQWTLSATALMSAINGVKSLITTVVELDSSLVDLQMATGYTNQQAKELLSTYIDMGQELGATGTEVADAASTWLKQGKSISETNTLIKDSMILSKLGSIDSASATKYLTAITKAYGVSVEDTLGVVDKLSAVDLASATDVSGLSEAVSEVSANAQSVGLSLDKVLGYIATIGETSGEAMSAVGNSIGVMLSRMANIKLSRLTDPETGEDLSNVETSLRNVGIELRDSNDSFKNFGDVLDTVASQWDSYSEVTQRSIASSISGKDHMNDFLILMNSYDTALGYTTVSTDSSGKAMQKFSAYEESVGAKAKILTASLQELASDTLNSGIIKGFLDSSSAVVQFVDKLHLLQIAIAGVSIFGAYKGGTAFLSFLKDATSSMSEFGTALNTAKALDTVATDGTALGTALQSLSASQMKAVLSTQAFSAETVKNALTLTTLSAEEQAAMLTTLGLAETEDVAIASTISLGAAAKGLWVTLAANPLTWIVGAVAGIYGLTKLYDHFVVTSDEIADAAETAKSAISDIKSELETTTSTVNGLKDKFAELAQGVDLSTNDNISLSTEDYETYLDYNKQLAELFPSLVEGYDSNGNAILDLNGNVNTITSSLENLVATQQKLASQKILDEMPDVWAGYSQDIEGYNEKLEQYQKVVDSINVTGDDVLFDLSGLKESGLTDKEIDDFKEYMKDQDVFSGATYTLGNALEGTTNLDEDSIKTLAQSWVETYITSVKSSMDSSSSEMQEYISSWLSNEWLYTQSDSGLQTVMQQLLYNSDFMSLAKSDGVDTNDWDDMSKWLEDNYLKAIAGIDDSAIKEELISLFTDTDMTADDKLKLAKDLQDYFDKNDIEISLDFITNGDTEGSTQDIVDRFNTKNKELVGKGGDDKTELDQFFKDEGIDTEDEYESWLSLTEGISSATDAMDAWNNAQDEAETTDPFGIDKTSSQTILDDVNAYVDAINSAKEEIADNGSLSGSSISDLYDTFSSDTDMQSALTMYQSGLMTESDLLDKLSQKYDAVTQEYVADMNEKLDADSSFYNTAYKQDVELVSILADNYGIDINNYSTAAGLKDAIHSTMSGHMIDVTDSNYTTLADIYGIDLSNYSTVEEKKLAVTKAIAAECVKASGYASGQSYTEIKNLLSQLKVVQQINSDLTSTSSSIGNFGAFGDSSALTNYANNSSNTVNSHISELETWLSSVNGNYDDVINEINSIGADYSPAYSDTLSDATDSATDSTEAFNEQLDLTAIKLEKLETIISRLDKAATNTYRNFDYRNSNLAQEISAVSEKLSAQSQAYQSYMDLANGVGLSSDYASMIENGSIGEITITDETLNDQITAYKEYYEAAQDCVDAIDELNQSLGELNAQRFDNLVTDYENILGLIEDKANLIDTAISTAEEKGNLVSTKYYEALSNIEQNNLNSLNAEYSELLGLYNSAMNSGTIELYSEAWYDMQGKINDTTQAIAESTQTLAEYESKLQDLKFEQFEYLEDKISNITEEADFLIDLLSSSDLYNDNGSLSDTGLATEGLHVANYETYIAEAQKYADEIASIKEQLASDPYDTDLADKLQEYTEAQQDAIQSAQDEKQAIQDLVEEGIQTELDALQDLIDKKNEALDATKDLYDYEQSIAEKTDTVSSLQKQIISLQGDDSEENQSTLQDLQSQLEDAQQDLKDTEYDQYIADQKELLDEFYSDTEEYLNERLDDIDGLMEDAIAEVNANASTISSTLTTEASNVGYTISSELQNIFGGSGSFTNIVSNVQNVINTISNNIATMISQLNTIASTQMAAQAAAAAASSASSSSSSGSSSGDSGSSGSSDGGSVFIYKEDYFDKSKLNTESSVVDRLKSQNYDSSFTARASYYNQLIDGSTYTGSSSQNQAMLDWMKNNGYSQGGLIGDAISASGEDGFVLARSGESILNKEQSALLRTFMAQIQPLSNVLSSANFSALPTTSNTSGNVTLAIDNITLPNVTDGASFPQQLTLALKDTTIQKAIRSVTTDQLLSSSNSLDIYKF